MTTPATDPTTLDYITLGIAVGGLVLAGISLAWQAVSWFYEGGRIKVSASHGMLGTGGRMVDVVSVQARNVGRGPSQVKSWGFLLPQQKQLIYFDGGIRGSSPLPSTLEGGHDAQWMMPLEEFKNELRQRGLKAARPFVRLGNGHRVKGKKFKIKL